MCDNISKLDKSMTEGDAERNSKLTASREKENPFVLNGPFSPEKILGRERLAQLMMGDSTTNWILSGELGIGKTSFLLYLHDQLLRQNEKLPLPQKRLAIYINTDDLREIPSTEVVNRFQLQMISGIEQAVAAVPELAGQLEQWKTKEEFVMRSLSRSEEAKSFKRLSDLAEFFGRKTNLLLLIDDFDLLVSKTCGCGYRFSNLRAFFGLTDGLQVIITSNVSVEELYEMIPKGNDSPFLNIFIPEDLRGIKREFADQILDRGDFSQPEEEEILKQAEIPEAGGAKKPTYHPARLIRTANERYTQREKK